MDLSNLPGKCKLISSDNCTESHSKDEIESTEYKLAILTSLFSYLHQDAIFEVLLSHQGDLEKAKRNLKSPSHHKTQSSRRIIGYQPQLPFCRPNVSSISNAAKIGQTLHLYSPGDIAQHTPCSIIHDFLPSQQAYDLLKELLIDAPSFKKEKFNLFDNVVESPHTMAFYVNTAEEQQDRMVNFTYNGRQIEVSVFCVSA